jgi:hypothetical protein
MDRDHHGFRIRKGDGPILNLQVFAGTRNPTWPGKLMPLCNFQGNDHPLGRLNKDSVRRYGQCPKLWQSWKAIGFDLNLPSQKRMLWTGNLPFIGKHRGPFLKARESSLLRG